MRINYTILAIFLVCISFDHVNSKQVCTYGRHDGGKCRERGNEWVRSDCCYGRSGSYCTSGYTKFTKNYCHWSCGGGCYRFECKKKTCRTVYTPPKQTSSSSSKPAGYPSSIPSFGSPLKAIWGSERTRMSVRYDQPRRVERGWAYPCKIDRRRDPVTIRQADDYKLYIQNNPNTILDCYDPWHGKSDYCGWYKEDGRRGGTRWNKFRGKWDSSKRCMRLKFAERMSDGRSFGYKGDSCALTYDSSKQFCWTERDAYTLMADKPNKIKIGGSGDPVGDIIGGVVGAIVGIVVIIVVLRKTICKPATVVESSKVTVIQAPAPQPQPQPQPMMMAQPVMMAAPQPQQTVTTTTTQMAPGMQQPMPGQMPMGGQPMIDPMTGQPMMDPMTGMPMQQQPMMAGQGMPGQMY